MKIISTVFGAGNNFIIYIYFTELLYDSRQWRRFPVFSISISILLLCFNFFAF